MLPEKRLNKRTIKEIEKARKRIRAGEFFTEKDAKRILKFNQPQL